LGVFFFDVFNIVMFVSTKRVFIEAIQSEIYSLQIEEINFERILERNSKHTTLHIQVSQLSLFSSKLVVLGLIILLILLLIPGSA
jgi:hypothetical protein